MTPDENFDRHNDDWFEWTCEVCGMEDISYVLDDYDDCLACGLRAYFVDDDDDESEVDDV